MNSREGLEGMRVWPTWENRIIVGIGAFFSLPQGLANRSLRLFADPAPRLIRYCDHTPIKFITFVPS